MAEVVVVGGGVGGMAAALRLGAAGHAVVLCERSGRLGGKLAERRRDGYTFPLGPSMITWPEVFADLAEVGGRRLADLLDLVPVDPIMRYRFADGSGFDAFTDPQRTAASIEAMAPGQGEPWLDYLAWSQRCWQASQSSFFAGPVDRLSDLRRGSGDPRDVLAVDPLHTLAGRARRVFSDRRLQMYAMRYATYSGSDPYRAPAALGCIPFLEHHHGAWYARGGIARLGDALAQLLADVSVDVRTDCPVDRIETTDGAVRGVTLAGGHRLRADVVVADVDARVVHETLLRPARRRYRGRRADRSTSAFLVLAGVRGRTPDLAHHNVFFSPDYRQEFDELTRRRRPAARPTVYLGCSAVDDPGQAPAGCENWTMLVNVPAGDPASWPGGTDGYRDVVLDRLAGAGLDVAGRAEFVETSDPLGVAARDGSADGAIYGTAHHGRIAPLRRPGNRGPVAGLYLVGGSTHPGGGLPLVARGAHIVSDLVAGATA